MQLKGMVSDYCPDQGISYVNDVSVAKKIRCSTPEARLVPQLFRITASQAWSWEGTLSTGIRARRRQSPKKKGGTLRRTKVTNLLSSSSPASKGHCP